MAVVPPPLTEFHCFPDLPAELRFKIFGLALTVPRTLTIDCERKSVEGENRKAVKFFSKTPPASLLHVCRESRFEALSVYKPSFMTELAPNMLYTSFEQDTIRCTDRIIQYFPIEEKRGVKRMMLDVADASYFGHFHMETVVSMTGLEHLELVTGRDVNYGWASMYLEVLHRDFAQARMEDLGWNCPRVVITSRDTGEVLKVIKSGALVPGWKDGDERPEISEHDL